MIAIRSKNAPGFRRDGTLFPHDAWTLLAAPTESQLEEPLLIKIEVSGPADPKLKSLKVIGDGESVDSGAKSQDDEDDQPLTPSEWIAELPALLPDFTNDQIGQTVNLLAKQAKAGDQVIVSKADIDKLHAQIEAANAELDRAKAELAQAKAAPPVQAPDSTETATPPADAAAPDKVGKPGK